jgi:kinetochore protein NDC80
MMPPKAPAAAAGAPGGYTKDPRPLRDKQTQDAMWGETVRWLRATGFETHNLKVSSIISATFRQILEHLVCAADPDYAFPPPEATREKGRWEPEMLGALAHLGYPFVGAIDLKWLTTPSAPFSWPSLLGILHFVVEAGKACAPPRMAARSVPR